MSELFEKFKGLLSNVNPHDAPPGSFVSLSNMGIFTPGTLSARRGMVPISFSNVTPSGTSSIIAVYKFDRPEAHWIIYERADGSLFAIRDGATVTLSSSLNASFPITAVRERHGNAIIVNGLDRGLRWNGLTETPDELGIDPPSLAMTFSATSTGGGATAGLYTAAYRYLDRDGIPSNLSPLSTHTASDLDTFTYAALVGSAQNRVASIQIYRSTSAESDVLYLVETIGVSGSILSGATAGGGTEVIYTVPSGTGPANSTTVVIYGSSVSGYNGIKTVVASTATTFTVTQTYSADSTGGQWRYDASSGPADITNDTATDTTISSVPDNELPIFYDNGLLLANRFVQPPNFKPFVAIYQDRTFYYGNVVYSDGTIEIQAASRTTLRGTGTAWTAAMVGRYVYPSGDVNGYLIAGYTSATELTLSTSANIVAATTGYTIRKGPTEQRLLYFSEPDEPESVPRTQNSLVVQENVQDHDFETGLIGFNSYLYALHERHIYAINFAQQGDVKFSARLLAERGCVNNRCWVAAEGTLYLLDSLGVYRISGGTSIEPLSDAIQDDWRNATLDFNTTKWWFAEYEPNEKIVRFYVQFTGDGNARPKRALCYSVLSGAWSTETYNWELGGSCRTQISSRLRQVVGGENDTVYLASEGLSDGVTTAIRGTVTSASSTTLTDSTASFAATVVNAPVAIVGGTGKGQIRTITARTSTQLTVAAWTTTPDSTSVYLIGGIQWSFKTGAMKFEASALMKQRQARLTYNPTANEATADLRRYLNHNASPESFAIPYDFGRGLTTDGTADATLDMLLSQFTGGNAPGFVYVPFDDGLDDQNVSDRWLALDLRGFQGLDRIEFYRLEVPGVEQD